MAVTTALPSCVAVAPAIATLIIMSACSGTHIMCKKVESEYSKRS